MDSGTLELPVTSKEILMTIDGASGVIEFLEVSNEDISATYFLSNPHERQVLSG